MPIINEILILNQNNFNNNENNNKFFFNNIDDINRAIENNDLDSINYLIHFNF